jgi:acetylornithine deacetylase
MAASPMAPLPEAAPAWREAVLAQIDRDELVELTRQLAAFRSFSGEERALAEWVAAWLAREGFDAALPEAEPGRPNAVGILHGEGAGPSLMFNGHLDIDPVRADYPGDPWACYVENGRLYGHGIQNMKAGVAAMLGAAAAVRRAGVPLRGRLIVAGVVGELQGGVGTVALLDAGLVPDYAIVPEPTWLNIRTVHAGWWQLLIHVRGQSGWIGSMHLQKTVNAVTQMARVIAALETVEFRYTPVPELPGLPRLLIGGIIGGLGESYQRWRPSMVPDRCTIALDVRLVPGQTIEAAVADIERVLDRLRAADPDLDVWVELPPATYRPPWRANKHGIPALHTPVDAPLVQVTRRNHCAVRGGGPAPNGAVLPNSYAGADSGHLAAAGASVINYGPSGPVMVPSWVELDHLEACARVLALTAVDLCGPQRAG